MLAANRSRTSVRAVRRAEPPTFGKSLRIGSKNEAKNSLQSSFILTVLTVFKHLVWQSLGTGLQEPGVTLWVFNSPL